MLHKRSSCYIPRISDLSKSGQFSGIALSLAEPSLV